MLTSPSAWKIKATDCNQQEPYITTLTQNSVNLWPSCNGMARGAIGIPDPSPEIKNYKNEKKKLKFYEIQKYFIWLDKKEQ